MSPDQRRGSVLLAFAIALLWLVAACAAGRPASPIRLPEGYEVLTAHCEARAPESCASVHVTGDPDDEEAWGSGAKIGLLDSDWVNCPADVAHLREPVLRAPDGQHDHAGAFLFSDRAD